MKLGLAAWGLRELAHEEKFALAAKLGVKLLEISVSGHPNDFLQQDAGEAEIRETRRLAEKYGIDISAACTGNDFTLAGDLAPQIETVERAVATAAGIGSGVLRIFAGFTSDSEMDENRFSAMLDALKCVRNTAGKCGVTLAVETHGGVACGGAPGTVRHFASVSTRIDTIDRILETGVSLLYDPANLNAAGVHEPERFFARYSSRVADVHLKDFRAVPGGLVPCACGQGGLDWKKLMHALKDYSGPALIEYELPGDVARGMRESLDFLRSCGA
ncbi:MAG: sugar phosphate isomerase/epimerase [Lentisphaeria bacterium]|nr:sugar phosphate isomerase/epimerase [Lentisphaeria bacterium]